MKGIYILSYYSVQLRHYVLVYAFPNRKAAEEYMEKADLWRKAEAPANKPYDWKLEYVDFWEKYPELYTQDSGR